MEDPASSDGENRDSVDGGGRGVPRDDELDDMVCDAQDAFFEGRYRDVIALAAQIHARDEAEEDTYDILLASHLALGQHAEVVAASRKWVALCEESLKQLIYLVESAYMLGDTDTVKDTAFKLAFLFESSQHDEVFLSGALLGVALALDCGLDFPDGAVDAADLLEAASIEPLAHWIRLRMARDGDPAVALPAYDANNTQAADFARCLHALHLAQHDRSADAQALLAGAVAEDVTGVAARQLLCGVAPRAPLLMSRVHPLFRRRLATAAAASK